jgi:protein-S-isoprenylcysteine O-methyltransferase Ste14
VALLIPPLVVRMRAEEKLLLTHFGSGYDAYCTRTPRLIPRVY